MKPTKLAVLIFAVCSAVAVYLGSQHYIYIRRFRAGSLATRDNLERLCTDIDLALQDESFRRTVGAGLAIDATSLPALDPKIKYNLSNPDGSHPYHLRLSGPTLTNEYGAKFYHYDLFVWSDGPNGINEGGKGDDISTSRVVVCPAE
jgi:hypothetical protein